MVRTLQQIKKADKKINSILEFNPNFEKDLKNSKSGKLKGKLIAVKANINVKGLHASCGSKVLENYKSPFDATVIERIKEEGGIILGMANCDEFAQGSSGETSAFGVTRNPVNTELITGGTSSGSAAAVAAGFCDMALGSDTGGSCRNPASHCGVVGVKPSYASVSRYGLIDSAMSFDQIGVLAKDVSNASLLLSVIAGRDERDAISKQSKKIDLKEIEKIPKDLKVGILDFKVSDDRISDLVRKKIKEASEKYKWKTEKIKIPYIDLALATYYPIQYVEFFSTTRRLDGRRYGKKIEDVAGPEVIRRILGGREISKAEHFGRYYHQALKVKKLIEDEFKKSFEKVDCVILPTAPRLPHKIGEKISPQDMYYYDISTVPANLAGNCAISIPAGKIDGIPVGMQIMCDRFQDEKMLQIARSFEKIISSQ